MDTVVFRITNPHWPRGQIKNSKYTIINFFIRQVLEGKTISIFDEGSQLHYCIFVEYLANAFIASYLSTNTKGKIFNTVSGREITIINIVGTINQSVGKGSFQNILARL